MDTFEFDSDAFYFCTEVEPNNFVVTKAPKVDMSHYARVLDSKTTSSVEWTSSSLSDTTSSGTSSAHSPAAASGTQLSTSTAQPPPIPTWFNRECKNTLMMFGPQQPVGSVVMPSSSGHHFVHHSSLPVVPPPLTRDEIKSQLKSQLEFYFSRENLMTDKYLKCQMDQDQYVPIQVIAGFRKVLSLTTDVELVAEALKESAILEVDASGEKVRANMKRTTIIIRETPEKYREEVMKLLADGPPFKDLKYGSNDSWYATYENELDTQVAYVAVQHKKNEVTQRPVCARIKAGGPLPAAPTEVRNGEKGRFAMVSSNGETGTIQMHELGHTLADFGFVPVATYRPGEPILSHFEYSTPTFRFSSNSLSCSQPPPQVPSPQHQYFYATVSSVSTTPRNFDELSTGSSTSTRTTASTYGRSVSRNGGGAGHHHNQYNNESARNNASISNEWRARGGSDRRFQNSHHQNHENGGSGGSGGRYHQGGGRGGYRGGHRNGHNNSNGHASNWRNEQNGHSQQHSNWRSAGDNHQQYNGYRHAPQQSSSSSSSASSKYFSPEAVGSPVNSGPSTPPPAQAAASSSQQQPRPVVTPTDLPNPPVWPAPNFDRRRKSSEASSATVTASTATNTLTPSTPVTPPVNRPTFIEPKAEEPEPVKEELSLKEELNREPTQPTLKTERKTAPALVEKPKAQSPPMAPKAPSFSFEETAFPCLPKKPEPEKKPQKPTFR